MYAPQLTTVLVFLGAVTVQAVPSFPSDQHFAAILARQAPGTPAYQCHADCGGAITGGRVAGYCTNDAWVSNYQACLACANEFDIWQYYGKSVGAAAAGCGLSTVPLPAPAEPTSTSAPAPEPEVTTTPDAPAATTDAPAATTDAPAATTDAPAPSTDVPAEQSTSTAGPSTIQTSEPTAAPTGATTTPPVVGSNSTRSAPSSTGTYVTISGGSQLAGSLASVGLMVLVGLKALW